MLGTVRQLPSYRGTMCNRLYYINPPSDRLKTETMPLMRFTFIMGDKEVYTCYSKQEMDSIADTLNRHRLDHELHIYDYNSRKTEIQKLNF